MCLSSQTISLIVSNFREPFELWFMCMNLVSEGCDISLPCSSNLNDFIPLYKFLCQTIYLMKIYKRLNIYQINIFFKTKFYIAA